MPSLSYKHWSTVVSRSLDEMENAHVKVGGIRRGRRYATQQINHAYTVLLASQFQRYCRDLHSEFVDHIVQAVSPVILQSILQDEFTLHRQLDTKNASPSAIASDKGYHKLEEIRLLHKKRYVTVIPEMDRVRNIEGLTAKELRALDANTRKVKSKKGKALLRKRGEMLERSFANVMNAGGMRRTTIRGLEKNRKRSLAGALCANLCLYARHLAGFGTVRQFRAAAKPAWA